MDRITLGKLVEECVEVEAWYSGGADPSTASQNFAFGVVCGRHDLTREDTGILRAAYGEEIARKNQREYGEYLILSAIRNTN